MFAIATLLGETSPTAATFLRTPSWTVWMT
jgi:hypothetical protein